MLICLFGLSCMLVCCVCLLGWVVLFGLVVACVACLVLFVSFVVLVSLVLPMLSVMFV